MALTDKQLKAIELLKSGMMQAEVSQIVGVSVRTLQRWAKIPEYCQLFGGEPVEIVQPIQIKTEPLPYNPHELAGREEMRRAEWYLLNSTQSAIMPKIERGDLRAIAVLLKIFERRCKLLGLDIQPLPAIRVAEYLENQKTTLEHEKLKLYSEALGRMSTDELIKLYREEFDESEPHPDCVGKTEEELIAMYKKELDNRL